MGRWEGRAGCHIPSFSWEQGWHCHHPYKMSTSWKQELPTAGTEASACLLKQMALFHPRTSLCKIKLSPFHQGHPWTSGYSTLFQNSDFMGVYSKFREGGAKLGSLSLLPHLLECHIIQLLCSRLRSWIPALPGMWGQSVYLV